MEMEQRGEQSISLSMSCIAEMATPAVTNWGKGGQIKSVIFCGQFNTYSPVSVPAPAFCFCPLCFPYFLPAFWAIL